ncbi:hypothetical protein ALC53_06088 [Atta colombica]|uniref:Uncharacterized protein n=1 Tax=Atta colombica TaxID=520822 RepID=A0A195BGS8_9HYME|nr:hypothetical protein ALC53_06088 [Atta colombica]
MYTLTCERTQTSTVTTPRSVGNTYPGAIFTQANRAVIPRAYPSSPSHTSTRIPLEVQVFGGFLNSVCGITFTHEPKHPPPPPARSNLSLSVSKLYPWMVILVTSASRLEFFAIHLHAISPVNFVDRRIWEREGGSLKKTTKRTWKMVWEWEGGKGGFQDGRSGTGRNGSENEVLVASPRENLARRQPSASPILRSSTLAPLRHLERVPSSFIPSPPYANLQLHPLSSFHPPYLSALIPGLTRSLAETQHCLVKYPFAFAPPSFHPRPSTPPRHYLK